MIIVLHRKQHYKVIKNPYTKSVFEFFMYVRYKNLILLTGQFYPIPSIDEELFDVFPFRQHMVLTIPIL